MRPRERLIAHVAILGILGGSLAAVLFDAELFPFSSYPMYSRVSRAPAELGRFFGVVGDRELPIQRSAELFPFSERTLRSGVSRILREDGLDAATTALQDQLAVYNARQPEHGGPVLDGIRYYTMVLEPSPYGGLTPRRGPMLVEAMRP